MSFRARLVLAAAYLVTAVVLALEIPLALNIKRRAEADFRASVFGQAALLSARIADGVASASTPAVRLRFLPGSPPSSVKAASPASASS